MIGSFPARDMFILTNHLDLAVNCGNCNMLLKIQIVENTLHLVRAKNTRLIQIIEY